RPANVISWCASASPFTCPRHTRFSCLEGNVHYRLLIKTSAELRPAYCDDGESSKDKCGVNSAGNRPEARCLTPLFESSIYLPRPPAPTQSCGSRFEESHCP